MPLICKMGYVSSALMLHMLNTANLNQSRFTQGRILMFTGRTLDFTVDLSKTAVIGRRYLNPDIYGASVVEEASNTLGNQSSLSRKGSSFTEADTCWKKAANSQVL